MNETSWMAREERDQVEQMYHQAVDILRAAGFEAAYVPCFAKPGENPGHITLGRKP